MLHVACRPARPLTPTAQDRFDLRSRHILRALVTDPSGRENRVGTVPVSAP